VSWRNFIDLAREVESDLHGGTAGVVDEAFYRQLDQYLRVAKAPAEAVAAIRFSHAMASWDWEALLAPGEVLARALRAGADWVSPDVLRDALVVANLRLGDPLAARRVHDELGRFSRRPRQALRSLLLESYVIAAEAAMATAAAQPGASPTGPRGGSPAPQRTTDRSDGSAPPARTVTVRQP
jgi:hypothetical protein